MARPAARERMNGSHRRAVAAIIGLLAVLLAATTACSGSDSTAPGVTATTTTPAGGGRDPGVVKLGALVSRSGAGAAYGTSQLAGLELAVRRLNERSPVPGARFELVVRDDASDVETAKRALTELIDGEQIVALFGPTLSAVAAKVDRIAVAAGVPVLAISNTTLDILTVGEPFWRVAVTEPTLAADELGLVKDRFGARTAGLVWDPGDRRSRDKADALRAAAGRAGIEVTGEATFTAGTTDFGPVVAQAQGLGVDTLLVAASDDDARRFFGAVETGPTRLDFTVIGNSVWRVALSERTTIPRAVAAAKATRGLDRAVLVVDPDDPYSAGAAGAYRAAAAANGVAIVDEVRFRQGAANDFGPAFRAVSDKAANGFLVAALAVDANAFLTQRATAGLGAVPLVGGAGFNSAELVAKAGPAAEGIITGTSWLEGNDRAESRRFVDDFTAANGHAPDQWAALGYGGVELFGAAARAGGGVSRSAVRTGLGRLRDEPTVLGPVTFGDDREARYEPLVQTVVAGRFVPLTEAPPAR